MPSLPLNQLIALCKSKNWKIGFTNGCFDNLHKGHVYLLTEARKHCDVLFVGINDDASVRELKGKKRPIKKLAERVDTLLASKLVEGIFPFNTEEELFDLMTEIQPTLFVKGGDYVGLDMTGAEYVRKRGGRVILIPLLQGYSTTRLN